jgi:hypothetical protein
LTRKADFLPAFTDEHLFPARFVEFMRRGNEQSRFVKPREILSLILKDDKEMKDDKVIKYDQEMKQKMEKMKEIMKEMKDVRDLFSLWMKSTVSYEKQAIENMCSLQNEIGLN